MLSVFSDGTCAPCPAPFNLAAHVLSASDKYSDKDALRILHPDGVENWSYRALKEAVLGTATGLLDHGLHPGDIVLLRLGNTVDFPLAYLGALAAGLVPVPTSAALTEPETHKLIDILSPAAILRDPAVPCAPHPDIIPLADIRRWRRLAPTDYHMGDPNRLGYVVFTSGTAGVPRAVGHAHRAIWARQMMFDDWYGLGASDRLLHAGAFNWTYTLGTGLMDPWRAGATALIPAPGTLPAQLPGMLAREEATIFAASPGVYRQLLKSGDTLNLPALRHGLSAGEKLPNATAEQWETATGRPVFEAFGMSECSTFISQPPYLPRVPGTMGRPQRGRRIAVLRDGTPVPVGTEGTIAVHRSDPGLMLGYLGAPEATAERMQGDWFLTGDQAVMHASGDMTYMGRADDMMNAGGFRVSPLEVENVLSDFEGITAVAAIEIEVRADTSVIAAVYAAPEALDEAALHAYVSAKLARYKQPRVFVHLPELPMGANGKILRQRLRAQFKRPQ